MAVNVKLKRSAVPGKIPLTSSLELGELALNTYDGCVYLKRDGINGEEVVKICGNVSTDQFVTLNTFTGNGTAVAYTLSAVPTAAQYSFVTINGVAQHTSAYTISGRTLTFSEAPVDEDAIEVRTLNQQVGSVQLRDYQTYIYQPTVNTATFSGADIYGNVLAYDLDKVEVFVNGVRLVEGLDYTATTGTSVVIASGAFPGSGDTVEVVSLARAAFLDWDSIKPTNTSLTTTAAGQVVDSFSSTNYRTAKYLVQMSHATLGFQSTEILVLHDGTNVYMTEYATIFTQNSLGTFDGSIVSGMVRLTVTPINTNTTVKLQRITVAA
jgi:hypothetical protein